MMPPRVLRALVLVGGIAVLVALPMAVTDGFVRHVLILGMLFAVLASSWDLTIGYAGLFNFAHVAFFAIGAYASGIAVTVLEWSPWAGMVLAIAASTSAAAIAFLPAIRLRGVYVALATFAFTQLCQWLVVSQQGITGGTQGMVGISSLSIADYSFLANGSLGYLYAAEVLVVISTVYLSKIAGSRFGRTLIAIRDDEEYAQSRGIKVSREQLLSFCLSAAPAGLVGAFYAHYIGAVSPDLFGFPVTALLLSMVWVGGVSTVLGPLVGGLLLTFMSESLTDLGPWRLMLMSTLIVISIVFFPFGLWGFLARAGAFARRYGRMPPTLRRKQRYEL